MLSGIHNGRSASLAAVLMICVLLTGLGLTWLCSCLVCADCMPSTMGGAHDEHGGGAAAICQSNRVIKTGQAAMAPAALELIFVIADGAPLRVPGFLTAIDNPNVTGVGLPPSRLFRPPRFS